ncbi:MAG: hypothetical protein EOQ31_36065, partial [Mesorhizobium sp.]
ATNASNKFIESLRAQVPEGYRFILNLRSGALKEANTLFTPGPPQLAMEKWMPRATRALILVEGHRGIGLRYVQAAQSLGYHPITLSADPARYDYLAAESVETIRV